MKKIGLIFGGTSSEHRISLWTGRFIFNTLLECKYEVVPILISRSGTYLHPKAPLSNLPGSNDSSPDEMEELFNQYKNDSKNKFSFYSEIDLCFIGLHGGNGENGVLQGFLEFLGIPYTGSGVLASALAMDKYLSYQIFEKNGFHVSPYFEISKIEFSKNPNFLKTRLDNFPYFLKPTCGGSSVSTGLVKNLDEANDLIQKIFQSENRALFQKPNRGIEVSCGVVEKLMNKTIVSRALYPTEIVPEGDFFDESAKYSGKSKEITPARISDSMCSTIRELALKAHKILGCRGYSRTDFIIENDIPYILETNTLPGMTPTSLIPQQIQYEGGFMKDFFQDLLEIAENYQAI